MIRLNLVYLICFWSAEIYNRNGCWSQSSGVCGTKGYPVCRFQLGHVCVLLQLSIAAWLLLAVGAPLGEQEHTGKLFLVGDSSQSFISWLPLWHNISPSPFKQHTREMRDYYSVRIHNSIQPSWHDTYYALPISWPDSTGMTQARGTVLLCPVSYYLHSQEVVVVNIWSLVEAYISLNSPAVAQWWYSSTGQLIASNHKAVCICLRWQCSGSTQQKHYPDCLLLAS